MNDGDGLDRVRRILGEARLDAGRIGAGAPVAFEKFHLQPELLRHLRPQGGEVPGLVHEHPIAG